MLATTLLFCSLVQTKAVALLFVLEECPIARKYAPEIKRLSAEYAPKGVEFMLVHVDPQTTESRAKAFAKEFGYTIPFMLDIRHKLAREAQITAVPSAAVYVKGKLLYTGRIDDRFPSLGQQRSAPSRRDLRIALDEVLSGKKVSVPKTKTVGCALPTL